MSDMTSSALLASVLPDENTDEGAMARLLVIEVGPQSNSPAAREAMGLMKGLPRTD